MFLAHSWCELPLDEESGYVHLRKLALTLPKLHHITPKIQLYPVNAIMKSSMALILDKFWFSFLWKKNLRFTFSTWPR